MIVTQLSGGLGNQMFQYAAGRALALRHNVPLYLDLHLLRHDPRGAYTRRDFELSAFSIEATEAPASVIERFGTGGGRLRRFVFRAAAPLLHRSVFVEARHDFHPQFNGLPANTYLKGFWQCEAYFMGCRAQLLRDFMLKRPLSRDAAGFLSRVKEKHTVGVHVRRGDYVSNPRSASFHGSCGTAYYDRALEIVLERTDVEQVAVFSDDIAWCRQHLSAPVPIIYSGHHAPAEDMWVLSQCQHQVIANSSFSWWAAWLNQEPRKTVVMPAEWFSGISSREAGKIAKGWLVA